MNKPKKIGKRKEVKVLAIAVPIIFLLGSVYWYLNLPPELRIKEGYGEITFMYIEDGTAISGNLSVSAATVVNNKSTLKLSLLHYRIDRSGGTEDLFLSILVNGVFSDDVMPRVLKISTRSFNSTKNEQDFHVSSMRESGLKRWPPEKLPHGTVGEKPAWVGYDVENGEFSAYIELVWTVYGTGNYTLRLTVGVVIGNTNVPGVMDIHLKGGDEK